jgi:hypothetical protein
LGKEDLHDTIEDPEFYEDSKLSQITMNPIEFPSGCEQDLVDDLNRAMQVDESRQSRQSEHQWSSTIIAIPFAVDLCNSASLWNQYGTGKKRKTLTYDQTFEKRSLN